MVDGIYQEFSSAGEQDCGGDDMVKKPKVLVLENIDADIERICAYLVDAGICKDNILTANDGETALALWEEHISSIGAVIMGDNMPDMKPADVAKEFIKDEKKSPLVCLYTNDPFGDNTGEFFDLGFNRDNFVVSPKVSFRHVVDDIGAAVGIALPAANSNDNECNPD